MICFQDTLPAYIWSIVEVAWIQHVCCDFAWLQRVPDRCSRSFREQAARPGYRCTDHVLKYVYCVVPEAVGLGLVTIVVFAFCTYVVGTSTSLAVDGILLLLVTLIRLNLYLLDHHYDTRICNWLALVS